MSIESTHTADMSKKPSFIDTFAGPVDIVNIQPEAKGVRLSD